MKITINEKNEGVLKISLEGRLDTITAPELEKVLGRELDGVQRLELDMANLEYISSAGLRVILGAQQELEDGVTVRHANDYILETFEMTGFSDFLSIE